MIAIDSPSEATYLGPRQLLSQVPTLHLLISDLPNSEPLS
jgi:hypothetical protein